MKLSRYSLLMGAFGALALAGCGGGGNDDTPSVYDPIPEYEYYKSRKVIVSADKKFEVIMYAYEEGNPPYQITCRAYGNQESSRTRPSISNETGFSGEKYQGDKDFFFWAPTGHKLYALITVYSYPSSTTFLILMEPTLVGSTVKEHVDFKDTNFSTEVLEEYDAARIANPLNPGIRLSPTGFSADGTLLLYSKVVTTDQGSVTTKYAFNYQTNTNTVVMS